MKLVLFSHPSFMNSKSMPLFSKMIRDAFADVVVWSPFPILYRIPCPGVIRKWLGYLDQYVIFSLFVFFWSRGQGRDTVFVFSDQALGPWVPLVKNRPHVIHCHDFMALRSALGEIPENPTGWSGRIYQKFIRWGFSRGRNFISVSSLTRTELHRYAAITADESVVVYNGLNYPYRPMEEAERLAVLREAGFQADSRGMLLHVGGGQWYKNRVGVVEMYAAYAANNPEPLPLWMVGPKNQAEVLAAIRKVPSAGRVILLSGLDAKALHAAYAHARLLLFPSLSEGFGWPIAEAMACGVPVLTTGEAPMTEVGGDAAFYHYRRRVEIAEQWALDGSRLISEILALSEDERASVVQKGYVSIQRFDAANAVKAYEAVYRRVLESKGAKN